MLKNIIEYLSLKIALKAIERKTAEALEKLWELESRHSRLYSEAREAQLAKEKAWSEYARTHKTHMMLMRVGWEDYALWHKWIKERIEEKENENR